MFSKWQARRDSCNNSQYNFRSHMQRVNVTALRCPHLLGARLRPWTAHTPAPIPTARSEGTHQAAREARGQDTHRLLLLFYSTQTSNERHHLETLHLYWQLFSTELKETCQCATLLQYSGSPSITQPYQQQSRKLSWANSILQECILFPGQT